MKEAYEYYWSIIVEPSWVQVGIWTIRNNAVQIISTSSVKKWTDQEELITASDEALSEAVKGFPEDASEPEKTVFGLPPSWVSEGQVKKEYLEYIRKLCSNLSLKPTGFVVLPEAIAHTMKIDDGAPLTGVIIGVHKSEIDVTLFRLGNLVGTVQVGRSVSVAEDVIEGLARFRSTEGLPSKFILYNSKDDELEDIRQQLIQADWTSLSGEGIKILHTPQIEVVDGAKKVQAVSLAGASELEDISSVITEEETEPAKPEDVGFVVGKDITETALPVSHSSPAPTIKHEENLTAVETGFGQSSTLRKQKFSLNNLPIISVLIAKFKRSRPSLPATNLSSLGGGNKIIKFALPAAILALIFFGAWIILPKAEVTVYVAPQILEESTQISFDVSRSDADFEGKVLPATVQVAGVDGEKTGSATGSKRVGDKAKGTVTIQNGTSSEIRLSANTVLLGPNDLKFSIDEAVTIPEAESTREPGAVTVGVTAQDFGSEYNLAEGEEFSVGNFPSSEVDAVVEEALTGGSSRDITAVAQSDLTKLENDLLAELKEKGSQQLKSQANQTDMFLGDTVQISVSQRNPSHKVGDEANSITLGLEAEVEGLFISQEVINGLLGQLLNDKVPGGYNLKEDQVRIEITDVEQSGDLWTANMNVRANLIPIVNPDEITKTIKGKTPSAATKTLSSIPGYSRVEVRIKPRFPSIMGIIPYNQEHISVEVVAER